MALPADYEHKGGHPVFDHPGPWTVDGLLELVPEDRLQRVELVEGVLQVSPLGTYAHQKLVGRVFRALADACPPDLEAMPGVNVRLSDVTLLIPDVTVNEPGDYDLALPVHDLVLACEVLSPSTRLTDLVSKRKLYADHAVPYYLVVDPRGAEATATLFELEDGEYREAARSEAGVLKVEQPFPVTIALSP